MTHTLHRCGSIDSLSKDYVVLIMAARGINDAKARSKLISAYQEYLIITRHWPLRPRGPWRLVLSVLHRIARRGAPLYMLQFVFDNAEDLTTYLRFLKENNIGLSVTVSGLFDKVNAGLEQIGLVPHTVQFSLGVFGKTERLPDQGVLDLTTMCGHHIITSGLVLKLTNDVVKNRLTPEKAARIMSKQCTCGVFNEARASELLKAGAHR